MIKVISFKIYPFVHRITALLEAKNIKYEVEYISLKNKPDWFLKISPNKQVPVLITENGTALFESDAIAEYLDEVYEPLIKQTPEEKALARAYVYQATKHYLTQCSVMRSNSKELLKERSEKLNKAFDSIEKVLTNAPYFYGSKLSNVDAAWLVLLYRTHIVNKHTCHDFLANYPKLKAWRNELIKTDMAKNSLAEDFEEKFTSFYLSNQTYLGSGKNVKAGEDSCKKGTCC